MNKIYTGVLFTLCLLFIQIFGENIIITGKVLDDENKPLDGVKISLMKNGITTMSLANGEYKLTDQSFINHSSNISSHLPLTIRKNYLEFTPNISSVLKTSDLISESTKFPF